MAPCNIKGLVDRENTSTTKSGVVSVLFTVVYAGLVTACFVVGTTQEILVEWAPGITELITPSGVQTHPQPQTSL